MIGDPTARGHGIGTAATTAIINYLHEQGKITIYSRTLTSNTVANHLFEAEGFHIFGEAYTDSDGLEWQNLVNIQD
jgi:RimJ/RimL family protein N-acetyltransferase